MSTKEQNKETEEVKDKVTNEAPSQKDTAEEKSEAKEDEKKENEEDVMKKQIDEANAKIAELSDKLLRLHAEFDNYKKRSNKEKAELIKNGGARAIESFLPVADDMERAMAAIETAEDIKAVTEGIKLIQEKLMQTFTKNGVTIIEAKDKAFDTDEHEAIAMIPATSEEQKGKVIDCVQTGYKLNDKVLRHAKVVVAQ